MSYTNIDDFTYDLKNAIINSMSMDFNFGTSISFDNTSETSPECKISSGDISITIDIQKIKKSLGLDNKINIIVSNTLLISNTSLLH